MDILCMSDLHFELHRDGGAEFLRRLRTPADLLILAGDICGGWMIPEVMGAFCKKYSRVIYVHGNHEFYRCPRPDVLKFTEKACQQNRNLYWLDCKTAEIDGVRFHGTPLWFKEAPLAPRHQMNDFDKIKDYDSWVYAENARAVKFLGDNVQAGDVVVTHHLPSEQSVPKEYEGDALNAYFVCNMEALIHHLQPGVWFHGHTHTSFDYHIDATRVVCNPHGYGVENIRHFSTSKIVTLDEKSTSKAEGNR